MHLNYIELNLLEKKYNTHKKDDGGPTRCESASSSSHFEIEFLMPHKDGNKCD